MFKVIWDNETEKIHLESKICKIGIVDADLLDGGTRHPNLALLKLAGFLHDHNIEFRLIESEDEDISLYSIIYISKVFSFTKNPKFFNIEVEKRKGTASKYRWGGTGFYALEDDDNKFIECRLADMTRLENDNFLNQYPNMRNGKEMGISMAHQMPYYKLYDKYIENRIKEGRKKSYYKDYLNYSIGFLTRGCFRKCPFCVNRLEGHIVQYSKIEWFLDKEIDYTGKLKRPYIYLWDDNFLASSPKIWRSLLKELQETGRPFQFRQGLDERILAESPYGEEIAETLSKCKYHGDYIFAFDNWEDRNKIVKALKIWRHYNKKETKFYLFCGFQQTPTDDKKFQLDIAELFMRICILMRYGCLGYIMRHEDYKKAPLPNIYVQIARWCNQPGFYRNLSFWEYCYKNQTYWEEHMLGIKHDRLKSYEEFLEDLNNGYYNDKKICMTLKTCHNFLESHKDHRKIFLDLFNMSFKKMVDPTLWERKYKSNC